MANWTTMYTTPMLPSYNTQLLATRSCRKITTIFFSRDGKGKSASIRRILNGTRICVRYGASKEPVNFLPASSAKK